MADDFETGYAFIMEGETEKVFYLSLIEYLCKKYGATFEREIETDSPDISYVLKYKKKASLIKFNVVNTVTQMPRAGKWFTSQCVGKYDKSHAWNVFLCYDQDSYKADISKFYDGDWAILRNYLKGAKSVTDMAAAADIEDIMLQDMASICAFLGCKQPTELKGKKGKIKLKNLFRDNDCTYHEGVRAKQLIDNLNMETLIAGNVVPLRKIEEDLFIK